jgi:hypothetical protein
LGEARRHLLARSRVLENTRRLRREDAWTSALLGREVLPLPEICGVALDDRLAAQARRCRVAAGRIKPGDRRPADRAPDTPL